MGLVSPFKKLLKNKEKETRKREKAKSWFVSKLLMVEMGTKFYSRPPESVVECLL